MPIPMSRRDALYSLGALFAVPFLRMPRIPVDPLEGSILEYQAGRASGAWTATEVVRWAIDRSYHYNRALHFTDLLADTALQEAAASDARARRGRLISPLDGVPVFAKSIHDVRGLPTTASSTVWATLFPEPVQRDAIEVARLRRAGAVILGKSAADDFAYRGNGTSSLSGQVENPYDRTRTHSPGGSSAGSSVAAACAVAFGGLGTDDGGSNRIPAQFTGVVGFKPTFGMVPRTGTLPTWPYLDHHGPMCRFVADAALIFDVLAGPDGDDALALSAPYQSGKLGALRDDALRGARIGLSSAHVPRDQMSAESVANFDAAVAVIREAGAEVIEISPEVAPGSYRRLFSEAASNRGDIEPDPNSPGPTANALLRYFQGHPGDARAMVRRGHGIFRDFYDVLPVEWSEMAKLIEEPYEKEPAGQSFVRSRAAVIENLAATFREHRLDAMVHPTMPFPATPTNGRWPRIPTTLSYGNWLGNPEVSVPAGYNADGMPAGNISFAGLPGSDARVLELAHSWERATRHFKVAPSPV
jgi:Asp-tRNA(Asn)/Glu-tRNA(Gln) amidotransferase A subunit family amidase